nr:hypothetical protein [Tanacetum cinerariifolium]
MKAQTFKETIIQRMNSIKKCIVKRTNHEQVLQKRLNERKLQIQGCTFQEVKALDAILEDNAKKRYMVSLQQLHLHLKRLSQNDLQGSQTESRFRHAFVTTFGQDLETFTGTIRTESKEQDTCSRSGNNAHADDADIRLIYDEEPMTEKCVFNANHDSYVTKFSNEVNSRTKVPSNKITNRNKPVEQISVPNKQERQIPAGHRFSIKKTFIVQKKTMTPRSCLRWKLTGRIFKTIGLRRVPTRKIFTYSTTKVDSEPLNGYAYITNQYKCEQTLDVSAGTLNLSAELEIHDHSNEPFSSKLVPKVVPLADSYIMIRVRITIPPSHNNAEVNM